MNVKLSVDSESVLQLDKHAKDSKLFLRGFPERDHSFNTDPKYSQKTNIY